MKLQYTICMRDVNAVQRVMGIVLTNEELKGHLRIILGLSFVSDRDPTQMLSDFADEGFDIEDFGRFEFKPIS